MVWLAFGGVVFFLMGLGLAADARGHARSALQWLPADQAAGLVRAYRAAGAAFMSLGAFLAFGGRLFPGWLKPPALGGSGRLAAGVLLLALGAGLVLAKRSEWSQGGDSGRLARELGLEPESEPWGPAVARWSGWALASAFLSFGAWLLTAG